MNDLRGALKVPPVFSEEEVKAITIAFYKGRFYQEPDDEWYKDLQKILDDFVEARIKEALISNIINGDLLVDYKDGEVLVMQETDGKARPDQLQ